MGEALSGLLAATERSGAVQLIEPRFRSTAGPWVRLGEYDIRLPPDVMIGIRRARNGTTVAVVGYLDNSSEAGRVQILVANERGVREMIGLMPSQLLELRQDFLGR